MNNDNDLKGHFDETLGAEFFLFSETAFLEIYTSKISGQNLEEKAFKAPIENSYFTAAIDLSLFFNCEQRLL